MHMIFAFWRYQVSMTYSISNMHFFHSKKPLRTRSQILYLLCKLSFVPSIANISNGGSHTSGSTGFPKPLIYTHDTAARNITMISLDPPVDFKSQDKMYQNKKLFISFPPFHVSRNSELDGKARYLNLVLIHIGGLSCRSLLQRRSLRHCDDCSYVRGNPVSSRTC